MVITEAWIKLMMPKGKGRLLAFASVVLDNMLAIHDLKIIEGSAGLFVSMPDRKLMDPCHRCRCKNYIYGHVTVMIAEKSSWKVIFRSALMVVRNFMLTSYTPLPKPAGQ